MAGLLSVGEMVIDFLPGNEEASYIRKAGGAPANVAIAVARQGCEAAFCGMVGDDDFGHFLVKTLDENGVEVCNRELCKTATTTMAFVTLNEQGERSFTFARKPGADMFLTKEHIRSEQLERATVVHAGSCSLSEEPAAEATVYALEQAHRLGKLVSFDVNYRNLMWKDDRQAAAEAVLAILPYVDLLKISDEEADMLGGEAALPELMEKNNIALLIETLGSKGARCWFNGASEVINGIKAECVDTCGAGDAFWGGFIATLLKAGIASADDLTLPYIREAIQKGNVAGSLCVQKKGAIESLPDADTVMRRWKECYC